MLARFPVDVPQRRNSNDFGDNTQDKLCTFCPNNVEANTFVPQGFLTHYFGNLQFTVQCDANSLVMKALAFTQRISCSIPLL